jgi:hypothetical protein
MDSVAFGEFERDTGNTSLSYISDSTPSVGVIRLIYLFTRNEWNRFAATVFEVT